jgi:hypothetical protein
MYRNTLKPLAKLSEFKIAPECVQDLDFSSQDLRRKAEMPLGEFMGI